MSLFTTIKKNRPKRTAFNLSHDKKLSCRMGDLVPILNEEIIPGDNWQVNSGTFLRLAPLIAPVMAKVDVYIHYFFVPNRILDDNWEDFITGDGVTPPEQLTAEDGDLDKYKLGDYFGLPIMEGDQAQALGIQKMPFLAYHKIWNEWYRDQDLQDEWEDGDQLFELHRRAWAKDYFTSARPWTSKGGEGILPITNTVTYQDPMQYDDGITQHNVNVETATGYLKTTDPNVTAGGQFENIDSVEGQVSINEFRIAHRIQKWFERQSRAGSRYTETILSHFGRNVGDARLNRPEYLSGGKQGVVISEVLNTTGGQDLAVANKVPQGEMSGHGISVGGTAGFKKTFNEHGWLIGIMSVVPKPEYASQGVHRSWTRSDKFDYPWPEFANLGEQAILNKELHVDHTTADEDTFGYQSIYSELKYKASSVHADMRDNLNMWNMCRIFDTTPTLGDKFIECDTTTINERIFAAGDLADQLWVQVQHNIIARRPLPYYGTPTI